MDFTTPKAICAVCHGKGGLKKLKKEWSDTNWIDCPYCEGYGFVDDNSTEEEVRGHLMYNRYKNNMLIELQMLGDVKVYTPILEGRDVYIYIEPFDRKDWTTFSKHLMKYAYHNDKVQVDLKHCFRYKGENEIGTYWELFFTFETASDIEGVIELLKFYNQTVRKR